MYEVYIIITSLATPPFHCLIVGVVHNRLLYSMVTQKCWIEEYVEEYDTPHFFQVGWTQMGVVESNKWVV